MANPIKDSVAAISCGVVDGQVMIDLDYSEDSKADVDANFVLTENQVSLKFKQREKKVHSLRRHF